MVWKLFGGGKKKETGPKARIQARGVPTVPGPEAAPSPTERAKVGQGALDAATVLAAIESARLELESRDRAIEQSVRAKVWDGDSTTPPDEDPATAAQRKKQLIQAALAVHRMKQSALSELSKEDRVKLRSMAETALGLGKKDRS